MALGATLGGLLADRFGRRQVFAVTLLIFGLATGAAALSWSVGALLVFRFLIGLGLGAELPVASTLVSEFAPARVRGRRGRAARGVLGGRLDAGRADRLPRRPRAATAAGGGRFALGRGCRRSTPSSSGWGLPESVRFLETARPGRGGRDRGAALRAGGRGRARALAAAAAAAARRARARCGAPGTAAHTAALWAVWFCINFAYYGAFIWLPSLLFASGFSLVRSFGFTLIITLAQLPGYAVAAYLIERWGRRPTLAVFLVGSAVGAGLFAAADGDTAVLVTGMVLSFFNLGAWGALYAVTPEVYPTALRATGAGAAAGFGRIASIAAPLCVPPLLDAGRLRPGVRHVRGVLRGRRGWPPSACPSAAARPGGRPP